MSSAIDQILQERKILITCGTGGVGKTTLSAAIAFRAALLGKKTVVITIDPAKRLATSLGLDELGDHPTDLTPALRRAWEKAKAAGAQGLPSEFKGTLAAIIPDTRRTFENFVAELAPTPEVERRVIENPIFQIFAKEFSGTNEYMALERLLALHRSGLYDCIILDTPPSRNTLAFLNAPKLLARFFDEKLIRWLVLPANRLVAGGMRKALGILEKLTGAGFMTHLFDFTAALFEVQGNFTANLRKIMSLLGSKEVGFLMVTTPTPETAPEILHFIETVQEHGFQFDGVALNRTIGYLEPTNSLADTKADTSPSTSRGVEIICALQERERKVIAELIQNRGKSIPICGMLPELARDVHSVEDLFHVAMAFQADSPHFRDQRQRPARAQLG